jgi:uncharacterized Zn ribbon protein
MVDLFESRESFGRKKTYLCETCGYRWIEDSWEDEGDGVDDADEPLLDGDTVYCPLCGGDEIVQP